jgi:hypothetical protein
VLVDWVNTAEPMQVLVYGLVARLREHSLITIYTDLQIFSTTNRLPTSQFILGLTFVSLKMPFLLVPGAIQS